jgi:hypothetical protein
MDESRRSSLVFGVILVLVGVIFLVLQVFTGLQRFINWSSAWPLIIVGVGGVFMISALLGHVPGLAVPACIIGGIGLLLYWQNLTGNWDSWAYAWALIPGFVGIGTILTGVLAGNPGKTLSGGLWLIVISLVMFFIFGSFLGGFGIGEYWPVLLIGLGFLILIRPLFRSRL